MKNKSFALIEEGNDDSPMIGVIGNVSTVQEFKERFLELVADHFDTDDISFNEMPNIFEYTPQWTVGMGIDGSDYKIKILETWIY